jgi:hypothetical protein
MCGRTDTCSGSARVKRKPTTNSEDSRRRLPHLGTIQVFEGLVFSRLWHRGFDVVVHAEEIRWVELILQGDEAVVIRAVSFTRDGLSLVGNIISVGARYQKRFHGIPALSRPLNVFFGIGGTFPVRPNHQIVRVLSMGKGSIGDAHACRSPMPVLESGSETIWRRTLARVRGKRLNRFVAQATYEV